MPTKRAGVGRFERGSFWISMCTVALGFLAGSSGCEERKNKVRTRDVNGDIVRVDLAQQRLDVTTYLEKHSRTEKFEVYVEDETEILINGALAKLADLRPGERAAGTVRVARTENGNKRLIAISIHVDRAEVLVSPGATDESDAQKPSPSLSSSGDDSEEEQE